MIIKTPKGFPTQVSFGPIQPSSTLQQESGSWLQRRTWGIPNLNLILMGGGAVALGYFLFFRK